MSRLEVEDLTVTASETATATEDVAALVPANEDQFIRRGDVEVLAVHLACRDINMRTDPLCDGMGRIDDPNVLILTSFSPV